MRWGQKRHLGATAAACHDSFDAAVLAKIRLGAAAATARGRSRLGQGDDMKIYWKTLDSQHLLWSVGDSACCCCCCRSPICGSGWCSIVAGLLPLHPTAAASPYTAAWLLEAAAGGWRLLYFVMVVVLQSRHKANALKAKNSWKPKKAIAVILAKFSFWCNFFIWAG